MSLAGDLRAALYPGALLEAAGRVPDPWQVDMLSKRRKALLALNARQVGKSEVLAVTGIHRAAWYPGTVVGIVAPTMRQSVRLLRRAKGFLRHLSVVARPVNDAATELRLDNGSSIEAWPGNNPDAIRGATLDLLLIDEAAWVLDEAWTACQPMLSMSDGDVMCASTPGGPAGWYYDAWTAEGDDWERIKVTAPECPRYKPEVLERARRTLGEAAYATEFLCEWREASDRVFSRADIDRLLGIEPDGEDDDLDQLDLPSISDVLTTIRSRKGPAA